MEEKETSKGKHPKLTGKLPDKLINALPLRNPNKYREEYSKRIESIIERWGFKRYDFESFIAPKKLVPHLYFEEQKKLMPDWEQKEHIVIFSKDFDTKLEAGGPIDAGIQPKPSPIRIPLNEKFPKRLATNLSTHTIPFTLPNHLKGLEKEFNFIPVDVAKHILLGALAFLSTGFKLDAEIP